VELPDGSVKTYHCFNDAKWAAIWFKRLWNIKQLNKTLQYFSLNDGDKEKINALEEQYLTHQINYPDLVNEFPLPIDQGEALVQLYELITTLKNQLKPVGPFFKPDNTYLAIRAALTAIKFFYHTKKEQYQLNNDQLKSLREGDGYGTIAAWEKDSSLTLRELFSQSHKNEKSNVPGANW